MGNKKTGFLSYGVVRGLIGQVIGTVVGLAFIALLLLILGMGWNPEPSWIFAMVVGFFGFLIGAAVLVGYFGVLICIAVCLRIRSLLRSRVYG